MTFVFLVLAIVAEVIATSALKASMGIYATAAKRGGRGGLRIGFLST